MLSLIEMQDKLKEKILGQDEAIHNITSSVYKFVLKLYARDYGIWFDNSTSILLLGDTGCGKTYLAKEISKLLDMCFVEINAKGIAQEGGWSGKNFPELLAENISQHVNGAVIFVDEFDKLCWTNSSVSNGDVNLHIQSNFLKYLDGFTIKHSDRIGGKLNLDTTKCLFIFAGAFSDMQDKRTTIGFNGIRKDDELREALIKYGMLPELLGRMQSICELNSLTEETYRSIIENEHFIYRKYVQILHRIGIDLDLEKENIIAAALKNKLGVRGLIQEVESKVTDVFKNQPDLIHTQKLEVIPTDNSKYINRKLASQIYLKK